MPFLDAAVAAVDAGHMAMGELGSWADTEDNHTCSAVPSEAVAGRTGRAHAGHGSAWRRLMLVSWTEEFDISVGKAVASAQPPLDPVLLKHLALAHVGSDRSRFLWCRKAQATLVDSPDEEYCPDPGVLYGPGWAP